MKVFKTTVLAAAVVGLSALFTSSHNDFTTANPDYAYDQMGQLNIGDVAPEIAMKGLDGEVIKLSDYRGKVVLIDFWASWCRPCRFENPNVVRAYHKYKDVAFKKGDGFTVFSVSLDQNRLAWQRGIEQDKLEWDGHVSDLQGWQNAAAQTYNVRGIPASYLIDQDGVIIGKNLRGAALEQALERIKK